MTNLTVREGTTLNQLQSFLKTEADRGQQILGRKNEQGEIVLYAKTKSTTFFDRLLGRTDRRQERAREGIQQVFDKFKEGNARTGETAKQGTEALFAHVGNTLKYSSKHGGLRAGDVRDLTKATTTIMRLLPNSTDQAPTTTPTGPSMQSIGLKPDDNVFSIAVEMLANGDDGEATADTLAKRLESSLMGLNPGQDQMDSFALSDGSKLRAELKQAMETAIANADPAPKLEPGHLDNIIDQAFNRAAATMLKDQIVPASNTTIPGLHGTPTELPHVTIGEQEYKPVRFLGEGGYALVYEFVSVDDPNDKIAFKITKENTPEAAGEAAAEIAVHRSAYGDGCKEVVGIEGQVRFPDGRIGIAVELAPNGTAFEMSDTIKGAVSDNPQPGSGKIAKFEADILRLTMLQDMAKGLDHLHSTQGVTHYDFKSPNVFIGKDGTCKVADMGLSLETDETTGLDDAGSVDNPLFKAPELLRGEETRSRMAKFHTEVLDHETGKQIKKLAELLPSAPPETLKLLAGGILDPRRVELGEHTKSDQSMLFFDRKVDVWGLGATALELFTGKLPFEDLRWNAKRGEALQKFGANRLSEPLSDPDQNGQPKEGAVGVKTGTPLLDNLMGRMLAPDPRDRPTPGQLLKDPAFNAKGVGSPEAKALIVALKSGDPVKIDAARFALQNVL